MNILVTGAKGLLGRRLVNQLSMHHKLYAIVKDTEENFFNANVEVIVADLVNFFTDILPIDIDVIYYLAQSNRFREFPAGANDMLAVNIETPLKLINWAQSIGVTKFIYASTGGVYKNPSKPVSEFFDINVNETHGFYPDSKLCAEILLKNYATFFETFVIIRPFFMYGEEQNSSMLIPRLIESVKDGREITLSGEEGIKINPIYIADAVNSVAKILEISGEHIINIAGKDIVSLKELVHLIEDIVGKPAYFIHSNKVQNDLIADISVMNDALEKPMTSIEEGLKKMVNNR